MTHAVGNFNHWTAREGPAKPFEKEDEEWVWLVFANFLVWNALFLQLFTLIRHSQVMMFLQTSNKTDTTLWSGQGQAILYTGSYRQHSFTKGAEPA